jgi:hypothetical protein
LAIYFEKHNLLLEEKKNKEKTKELELLKKKEKAEKELKLSQNLTRRFNATTKMYFVCTTNVDLKATLPAQTQNPDLNSVLTNVKGVIEYSPELACLTARTSAIGQMAKISNNFEIMLQYLLGFFFRLFGVQQANDGRNLR